MTVFSLSVPSGVVPFEDGLSSLIEVGVVISELSGESADPLSGVTGPELEVSGLAKASGLAEASELEVSGLAKVSGLAEASELEVSGLAKASGLVGVSGLAEASELEVSGLAKASELEASGLAKASELEASGLAEASELEVSGAVNASELEGEEPGVSSVNELSPELSCGGLYVDEVSVDEVSELCAIGGELPPSKGEDIGSLSP